MTLAFLPTGVVRPAKKGELYLYRNAVVVAFVNADLASPIYSAVDWEQRVEAERNLVEACQELLPWIELEAGPSRRDKDAQRLLPIFRAALAAAREAGIGGQHE